MGLAADAIQTLDSGPDFNPAGAGPAGM